MERFASCRKGAGWIFRERGERKKEKKTERFWRA